uniref:Riboflavin transporter n=1 Tax=Acrobeloides nanus TaxID=290746 RepID=A0A914DJU8_9BILA
MSISELVPSLIALIQGSSNYVCEWNNGTDSYKVHYTQPKFGVKAYNLIIFGWLCLTIVAFVLLHWGRHLIVQPKRLDAEKNIKNSINVEENRSISTEKKELHIEESVISIHTTQETTIRFYIFLGCQLILNVLMNGVVPSVATFATLPYSPVV